MGIKALEERIRKAQEKIQKKRNTITKKEKWIASGKYGKFEIENFNEDISRLRREISETEKTVEKYKNQLAGEVDRERELKELPECLKNFHAQLTAELNDYDLERQASLKKQNREIYDMYTAATQIANPEEKKAAHLAYKNAYKEFCKALDGRDWKLIKEWKQSDIEKDNEKTAKAFILQLIYRVREKTGEVTDWSGLWFTGRELNGIVIGKEGRAKAETIIAGGYNIQRLHLRVLVHEI